MNNLNAGTKNCPLISDMRDVTSGIAQGDFHKVALNGGYLALQVIPLGNGGPTKLKMGMRSG